MNYLLSALLLFVSSVSCFAHGSMGNPISRVHQVFLENPMSPTSDAGKAAVAVAGTQAFYDWHEVSLLVPQRNYRELIPDGQLASAGRTKYAGLDLPRVDWPATKVQAGPYDACFSATVPHSPSRFEVYISKNTYDPTKPLKWSDLEPLPLAKDAALDGNTYRFSVNLPQRVGRHVLYVIWQRDDPAGEAFFSLSDLDFGGYNFDPALQTSVPPAPKKASIPGGCGTGCACPKPVASPSPTPS
ncbi:MAG: lytic polysaccharide monooxygenase, partial [Spartobacteria bacterium]